MKNQSRKTAIQQVGMAITTYSNGSDKTDSSEKPHNCLSKSKMTIDEELEILNSKIGQIPYSQPEEEQVPLRKTDVEMQLDIDTVFSFDSIMSQDDQSVHSKVVSEYGKTIIDNLKAKEFTMKGKLDKHEIKGSHRKQMVAWMSEVMEIFKCPVETFFLAVQIMDRYLEESKVSFKLDELHEIGITAMFISSKYQEVEPLTLDLMIAKVAHGKVTETQLLKREKQILNTLKFKLSKPTVYDFIESFTELFSSRFESDEEKYAIKKFAVKVAKNGISDRRIGFTVLPSEVALCAIIIAVKDHQKKESKSILIPSFSAEIRDELTSDESSVLQIGKRLRKLAVESVC